LEAFSSWELTNILAYLTTGLLYFRNQAFQMGMFENHQNAIQDWTFFLFKTPINSCISKSWVGKPLILELPPKNGVIKQLDSPEVVSTQL
jgi:hypothetical protein